MPNHLVRDKQFQTKGCADTVYKHYIHAASYLLKTKNYQNRPLHPQKSNMVFQAVTYELTPALFPNPLTKSRQARQLLHLQPLLPGLLCATYRLVQGHYKHVSHPVCFPFLFQILATANGIGEDNHTKMYPLVPCSPHFPPPHKQFGQRRTVVLKMWSRNPLGFLRLLRRVQEVKNWFHDTAMMRFTLSTIILSQVYGRIFQTYDHNRLNTEAAMKTQLSSTKPYNQICKSVKQSHSSH